MQLSSVTATVNQLRWSSQGDMAPFCSSQTAPAQMVQFQLGKHSFRWILKVCCLSHRVADVFRKKSLPLVPDWSILMKMRTPNPHSLINPKITACLSGIELLWLVVGNDNGDISAEILLDKGPLSLIDWNGISRIPLSWLAQMSGTQCRQAVRCRFSLKSSLCSNDC